MLGTVFAAAPGHRVGFIALAWFVAGAGMFLSFAVLSLTR